MVPIDNLVHRKGDRGMGDNEGVMFEGRMSRGREG